MNCSPRKSPSSRATAASRLHLIGDRAFLIERQRQRVARFVELIPHRVDTRDLDVHVAVEQMLHQHHRVVSFLDRLAVKVLR